VKRFVFCVLPLALSLFPAMLVAQAPAKVDFVQDVQPILRQNCISCHGPKKQNGGMRVDRRSSAMRARRIVPGSSENSFLYHRASSSQFGPQMPPTGDLRPEQIQTLKAWIDQGAPWPDALANEVDLPPVDPVAVALVETLRKNDRAAFLKAATANPKLLNARALDGATPFMYAILYSDTPMLARLLKMGADANAHNDSNTTALMWAARDLAKTELLVAHGANVNARSDEFRTPLMIAARRPGDAPIVKFLLDHGANANPNPLAFTASSPLLEALNAGDPDSVKLLLAHGADAPAVGEWALGMAVQMRCADCLQLLAAKITDKDAYTAALQDAAVYGDTRATQLMLDHGADVKAYDSLGRTALMYAAASDVLPLDEVKLLVARGADVNAKSKHPNAGDEGLSVAEIARRHGETPVLAFLRASGATLQPLQEVALHPKPSNDIRSAIQDSLPLLQTADANFAAKSGCISCHNNSLSAMTMGAARKHGFRIDEQVAAAQVRANVDFMGKTRDRLQQGFLVTVNDNFSESIMAYMLLGLHAEGYKPDINTDTAAMHILLRQKSNGEWAYPVADTRQPLCLDYIGNTAKAMRALQLYAPVANAAEYKRAVQLAATWLASAHSSNNDDRSWRLTGLAWAGTNKPATQKAMEELLAAQKTDGGWSDLPLMDSTAYATGKSLVALRTAGLSASDPRFRRGIKWLLDNQQTDGTWYVQTRAMAFQPAFDAGFPHHHSQWISAAGTSWAAMALTLALPEPGSVTASVSPPHEE
jgi:ankyrin repeat protein